MSEKTKIEEAIETIQAVKHTFDNGYEPEQKLKYALALLASVKAEIEEKDKQIIDAKGLIEKLKNILLAIVALEDSGHLSYCGHPTIQEDIEQGTTAVEQWVKENKK